MRAGPGRGPAPPVAGTPRGRAGRRPAAGRRRPAAALGAGAVALLLLVLGGCGIPTDSDPRIIAAEPSPTTLTPETSVPAGTGYRATIYLSRSGADNALVAVRRPLSDPPTPERVLEALLSGPTKDDQARGYISVIPPDTALIDQMLENGTLTVNLSELTLQAPNDMPAYAQMVLTVTELDEVDSVRFQVDGTDIPAPTPNRGSQAVVVRSDYRSLDPG